MGLAQEFIRLLLIRSSLLQLGFPPHRLRPPLAAAAKVNVGFVPEMETRRQTHSVTPRTHNGGLTDKQIRTHTGTHTGSDTLTHTDTRAHTQECRVTARVSALPGRWLRRGIRLVAGQRRDSDTSRTPR